MLVTSTLFLGLHADALACRLALALAIDVSHSVDSRDYAIQFRGLAEALRDPEVRTAILDGGAPVAASAFEWSGPEQQATVAGWSLLFSSEDIDRLADRLESHRRTIQGQKTAIGSALAFGHELLRRGPDCSRAVIDVSGDGYSNVGPAPDQVYRSLDFSHVTVNALVIGGVERPELRRYFEAEVIRGPGAFAMSTRGFADYADAIRRKLLREIRRLDALAAAAAGRP